MSCASLNVTGELAVRGYGVDEVLGNKDGAADTLLFDRPDLYISTSIQYIALNESNTNQFLAYCQICNLFLDILDLGVLLTVSGKTPISSLMLLSLFTGHLTLSLADLEHLACCLNSSRSISALSRCSD